MNEILQQISAIVANQRRQSHLKQAELARNASVSLKTVTNIETAIDKHDIGIQKVLSVLNELGIKIEFKAVEHAKQFHEITYPTIRLANYPQLKLLTWNRGNNTTLDEMEAFELYEKNWRHIDEANLTKTEKTLIQKLTHQYGEGVMNV